MKLLVQLLVPEPKLNRQREPEASKAPRFCKPLLLSVVKERMERREDKKVYREEMIKGLMREREGVVFIQKGKVKV